MLFVRPTSGHGGSYRVNDWKIYHSYKNGLREQLQYEMKNNSSREKDGRLLELVSMEHHMDILNIIYISISAINIRV